jgi:mono/diheme cytochrome c family protein
MTVMKDNEERLMNNADKMNSNQRAASAGIIAMAIAVLLCMLALASPVRARSSQNAGSSNNNKNDASKKDASTPPVHTTDPDTMRIQGEQRYHINCGRCHAAPQKFPPRMMATVLRHMRVRATITDEDMRLVLFYMTQ